ncbi:MAG: hypothetical protein M3Y56_14920, partial [Armatimonadota bacterium]|nr:hypothetical protein [Armatimonadota bacterium]
MEEYPLLKNAPIVESLLDIQVEAPPAVRLATLKSFHVLDAAVAERIRGLQREADWDGEGAEAITRETCEAAIRFLERLPSQVNMPRV